MLSTKRIRSPTDHAEDLAPHDARCAAAADSASGPGLDDTATSRPIHSHATISLSQPKKPMPQLTLSAPPGAFNPSIARARIALG